MLKKEELIELNWEPTEDEKLFRKQLDNGRVYKLEYNWSTGKVKIMNHNDIQIMDCGLQDQRDLLQQMQYLGIPQ